MSMISQNICLSDIPANKRFKGKDGKTYTNIIVVDTREPDKFGNTHTVYMSQSEAERAAKAPKEYIGRGKEFIFGAAKPEKKETPVAKPDDNNEDLPF